MRTPHVGLTLVCAIFELGDRKRYVAPALGYGSLRWLWGKDMATNIDAMVHHMFVVLTNLCRPSEEGWLNWHVQSMSATKQWLTNREWCPWPHEL